MKEKYEGVKVVALQLLKEVSVYNFNYYTYNNKLLFGHSDDDNTTEWFEINGDYSPKYIGESYTSERPEVIHVYEQRNT